MSQKEVWDKIAKPWKTFMINPVPEVESFLRNKKGNILDMGCGSGRNFFKAKGIIYGVDFSENMLRYAKEYADSLKLDVILKRAYLDKLPFDANTFDNAIFISTLHCIDSEGKRKKTLKELYRVLKKNGEAMISVWDKEQKIFRNFDKDGYLSLKDENKEYLRYYYLYDRKEFINLLKESGFKIIKIMDRNNAHGFYSKRNILVIVKK